MASHALMNVELSVLPNGLQVVTAAMPHVQSVSLGVWIGVGSRHETAARLSGVSHFIEHMLFKGTRRRNAIDITRAIEGRGGYLNAFTQEEATCYYAQVPSDYAEEALDVLLDMYMAPRMAAHDFELERGVILEELKMYRDQPHHQVEELFDATIWKGHPLGRSISGTDTSLAVMTPQDLAGFMQRAYVSGATVVAFAGKVEHAECVAHVARLTTRRLRCGKAPAARPAGPHTPRNAAVCVQRTIEQAHLSMGIRTFGIDDPRRFPLRLINAILGENMSSRLFQILREHYGLAYSVGSSFQLFAEVGTFVISAGLEAGRRLRGIDLIVREFRRLRDKPVSARTLMQAKEYSTGQIKLGIESTSSQMMLAGENILAHGRFITPEEVIAEIQAVTAEDIHALAHQLFLPENFTTAMIAPDTGEADTKRIEEIIGAGLVR
jgi:predicted Zn-dependent peptidase